MKTVMEHPETMPSNGMQQQIDSINRKLDLILEEIALQQRHRREMEDLKDDLMRVGKDLYDTAAVELDQVHDSFQTEDLLHLFKKILRNTRNLTKTLEALENTSDFLADFTPVSRELFIDTMQKLDEFDRKGYFAFLKELGKVADNVVTSYSVDDVRKLGENIVTILDTVKNLTQPDTLQVVNNALEIYKKLDIEVDQDVTMRQIVKELRSPEMKRGMLFMVRFLKSVAEHTNRNQQQAQTAV